MSALTHPSARGASRWRAALLTAALVALTGACTVDLPGGVVVGSGEVTSEVRKVSDFSEVEAHGGIRLELVNGATHSVVVTAQPNLLPITTTTVSGSRLTVDTTSGYTTTQGITVKVTTPSLSAIALSGGAIATGDGVTAASLSVDTSGGARLTLSGTADALDVKASGGAILELGSLRVKTATVDVSGGVVATLNASSSLTGNASGGVVIHLATRPGTVNVETSGGAAVVGP
jgi:hypothetical protein